MAFLYSKSFWSDAFERAVKTFAQTAVALIGTQVTGILDVNWVQLVSAAGLAALVSVLTSIGSGQVGDKDSASLVK